jgi:DeoR family suf operon transcriptional repressor
MEAMADEALSVPPVTPPLASLPSTRRALLVTLKRLGQARAEELAEAVEVTVSAVRQHLAGLMRDGLVEHMELRGAPGRPKHLYHLSPAAEAFFPRAYGELTNELLDYVAEEDPELVDRVFERRRRRRVHDARARLAGKDLESRVAELTRILDEDGYVADSVAMPDGSFRIVEHNCAIFSVARRYGQACSSEIDFIRTVLSDARVERVAHMMAGARMCAYEVRPVTRAKRSRAGRSQGARRATLS